MKPDSGTADKLGCAIRYLETERGALTLEEARREFSAGKFSRLRSDEFSMSLKETAFWLTLELVNDGGSGAVFVIDTGRAYLHHLSIWVAAENGLGVILQENDRRPFSKRPGGYRSVISDGVFLDSGERVRLWVYAEFNSPATLPLAIYPAAMTGEISLKNDIPLIIFYSVALVLLAVIVGFAAALRSRVSLVYAGFFAAVLAYNAQLTGTLFAHAWPEWPQWNAVASHPIGLIAVVFALLLAAEFNRTGRPRPLLKWAIRSLIGVAIVFMLFPLFFPLVQVKSAAGLIILGFLVVQLWASVAAMRDRVPGRSFFLGGSLILFAYLGAFVAVSQIDMMVENGYREILLRYGQLADGFVFYLAVVRQTWVLRQRENDARLQTVHMTQQFASDRHDIRQTLLSLRMAIERLSSTPEATNASTRERLSEGLAYLENIVAKDRSALSARCDAADDPTDGLELSAILTNAAFMFAEEANERGTDLRVLPSAAKVLADPVDLFRVLTNLIANALKHSRSKRILVGVRRVDGSLAIDVLDGGKSPRGGGSSPSCEQQGGEGLGLGIVTRICEEQGWTFAVLKMGEGGTHCRVSGIQPCAPGSIHKGPSERLLSP